MKLTHFIYIYNMNLKDHTNHSICKTIFDYSITIVCLIILFPVIIVLSVFIRISGKGPILYSQERIGRFGKVFSIYKFRSLYPETDEGIYLLSSKGDKRITPLGRFIRKYKLDEIPNFINVLKGEQQHYIDQIIVKEPGYKKLQSEKPGITSWGQVKYGYASNVDEMIERLYYDMYYYENKSIWFDVKIIVYTFISIVKGKGI
jgi:lipopolysaccharide/colanic/teichoic acid biosynthesis glycosyltransferase